MFFLGILKNFIFLNMFILFLFFLIIKNKNFVFNKKFCYCVLGYFLLFFYFLLVSFLNLKVLNDIFFLFIFFLLK